MRKCIYLFVCGTILTVSSLSAQPLEKIALFTVSLENLQKIIEASTHKPPPPPPPPPSGGRVPPPPPPPPPSGQSKKRDIDAEKGFKLIQDGINKGENIDDIHKIRNYLLKEGYPIPETMAKQILELISERGIKKTLTKPEEPKTPTKPSGGTGVTIKEAIDFANDALIHDRIANITMQGVIKYLKDHNKYPSLSLAEEGSFNGMIRTLARNAAEKKAAASLGK